MTDLKAGEAAGNHCHRESAYIQEIAQEVAMRKLQNIWVDGSLRDGNWFKQVFQNIRRTHPKFKIAIFEVTATEENVRSRIKKRAAATGRDVPEDLIVSSLQSVSNSIHLLTPLCDFVAKIGNDGVKPELLSYSSVDSSGNWGLISDRFAKPPLDFFPKSLAPLELVSLDSQCDVSKACASPPELFQTGGFIFFLYTADCAPELPTDYFFCKTLNALNDMTTGDRVDCWTRRWYWVWETAPLGRA